MGNGDFLYLNLPIGYLSHHHGDLLVQAPGAAGAGIEPQYAPFFLLHIFVGVAEYHHIHSGEVRRNLIFVVDHTEGHAAQGDGEVVGRSTAHSLSLLPRTL